ncbi:MAG: helix-turn-helix domain-containing protein [Candidatus Brocadiia bacterium]
MADNTEVNSPWLVIEQLREKHDISKKLLADKLQINYNYLVDLLNGRYSGKIDNQKLRVLAEVFNISIEELMGMIHLDDTDSLSSTVGLPGNMPLYILQPGQPNKPLADKQPPDSFRPGPDTYGQEAYAIRLDDNSLFPPCRPGSVFILSPSKEPNLGDLILVVMNDQRCWLMELNRVTNDMLTLRYYNTGLQPITIMLKDIQYIHTVVSIYTK